MTNARLYRFTLTTWPEHGECSMMEVTCSDRQVRGDQFLREGLAELVAHAEDYGLQSPLSRAARSLLDLHKE